MHSHANKIVSTVNHGPQDFAATRRRDQALDHSELLSRIRIFTDGLVRAVTFWSVSSLFALAIIRRFRFFGLKNERRVRSTFVRSVAKRLVFGKTACAIGVFFSCFDFHLFRETCCNFWLVHIVNSVLILIQPVQCK